MSANSFFERCSTQRQMLAVWPMALLLLLWASAAQAHGPKYTHLAREARLASDPNATFTAADVAKGLYDDQFKPVAENVPNLGFSKGVHWMRFSLENAGIEAITYYLETARPVTNVVNFYRIDSARAHLLFASGDNLPFTERPIVYRKFLFPITLKANERAEYLIEAGSDGEVLTMPIKLWNPNNFNAFVQRENLTQGIYFGLLIFTIGLFAFFALALRQAIYTYYVSYLFFLFFMQASLDGIGFEYLWPQSPWMANHSVLIFSAASVFLLMVYAAEFLKLSQMPRWFKVLYKSKMALVVLCFLGGLTEGVTYELTFPLVNGLSLVSLIGIIIAIIWNIRNHIQVSAYFSLGFVAVLLGGIFFILTNFNVIESEFINNNAIKFGSAAEVIFLSLAMVNRYRDVEREKERAKTEALETLEELNRVTAEQNVQLEHKVAERTAEINEKNELLAEKNKEIIDSITYAKRIQSAILPPIHVLERNFAEVFVLYLPKDIVAGDFYFFDSNTHCRALAVADCTGHGVPGALVSVVCHNALKRTIHEHNLSSPADVLDKTSEIITSTFALSTEEIKDGMDLSLLTVNTDGATHWAGANNPLYVVNKSQQWSDHAKNVVAGADGFFLHELAPTKRPVGRSDSGTAFKTIELPGAEQQTFYLFTDGFADQFGGERGKKFKYATLKELLLRIQPLALTEQREALRSAFNDWRGELEQVDDVCLIGVRV